jgi:hypothetical protein
MRLVIPIPAEQCRVARIIKQDFPRRRFDVAIAKQDVGSVLMAQEAAREIITHGAHECERVTLAYRHHFSGSNHL